MLHIINNLGSGGAEKLLEETLPLLNRIRGLKVDVLLLTGSKNVFSKSLKSQGVQVDVLSSNSIYNPFNIIKLKTYIEKEKYNIVHAHLFPTQYWVAITKKILKSKDTKFITTEHSNNNRRRGKYFFRLMDRYIYSSYDSIICVTDKVCLNLVKWLKPKLTDMQKFLVINNGINIAKYSNAIPYKKSELCPKFSNKTKLICMVARFSEAKDHPTLIRAMMKLQEDVHLLLIGEGKLKHQNEELAKELGVKNRVHFLGFRNDVEKILKTSDIVVISSNWEGLSLASLEGMASGKPLVASKVEGLEEIVAGYGLLFKHGDSDELSEILQKLLHDDKTYTEVSKKCVKRAEKFSTNGMIKSILSVYNRSLNRNIQEYDNEKK